MEGVGSARWQEWIGLVMIPQHETPPYTLFILCVHFDNTLCTLCLHGVCSLYTLSFHFTVLLMMCIVFVFQVH